MADQDKYVLLRGKEHQNVFWTTNTDIDTEKFDILYTGNTSEEMVREWSKYNPFLLFGTPIDF
jgi:hypothetical protein